MKLTNGNPNSKKKISLISATSSSDSSFHQIGDLLIDKDNDEVKKPDNDGLEYLPTIVPTTSKSSANSFLSSSSRRVSSSLFSFKKHVKVIKTKQSQLPISVKEIQDINYNNIMNGNVRISQVPYISSMEEVSPLFKMDLPNDATNNQDLEEDGKPLNSPKNLSNLEQMIDGALESSGLFSLRNSVISPSPKNKQFKILYNDNKASKNRDDLSIVGIFKPKTDQYDNIKEVVMVIDGKQPSIREGLYINNNWNIPRHMASSEYKLTLPSTCLDSNMKKQANKNIIHSDSFYEIIPGKINTSSTSLPNQDLKTNNSINDSVDSNINVSSAETGEEYYPNIPSENKDYTYLKKVITNIDKIVENNKSSTGLEIRSVSPLSIINYYADQNSFSDENFEVSNGNEKDDPSLNECKREIKIDF